MIAPIYTPNAKGRPVYLPEEMILVKFASDGTIRQQVCEQGWQYAAAGPDEIFLFVRKGKCIPVAEAAECVEQIHTEQLTMLGYEGAEYLLYEDDGVSKEYDCKENYRMLQK